MHSETDLSAICKMTKFKMAEDSFTWLGKLTHGYTNCNCPQYVRRCVYTEAERTWRSWNINTTSHKSNILLVCLDTTEYWFRWLHLTMMSKRKIPTVTAQLLPTYIRSQWRWILQFGSCRSYWVLFFSSLLVAIQDSEWRLDRKLADLRGTFGRLRTRLQWKQMWHNRPYEYKKKAHEEQACFTLLVKETFQEAQEALAPLDNSLALQHAWNALEKGTCLLVERQKLIKIANR